MNEKELSQAVDRMRDGETVMGVSCDDVIDSIYSSPALSGDILYLLCEQDTDAAQGLFNLHFKLCAKAKLREAYRKRLENKEGCDELRKHE